MQSMLATTRESGLSLLRSLEFLQNQSVRWIQRPKPYWIGVAKTKMFKFKPLVQLPKDEDEEIRKLYNNQRAYRRSFSEFMKERHLIYEAKQRSEASETTEEAEYSRISEEIEKDNAVVRAIREEALVKEWNEVKVQILEKKEKYEERERMKRDKTELKLLAEMERLKSVIHEDKIDEAIEKALTSEVDYNFAIDKKGNVFNGRVTHISR